MQKQDRKILIQKGNKYKLSIACLFLIFSFNSFTQDSIEVVSIKSLNKSVFQSVLGNLLSKITYERISELNMTRNIIEQDFSSHLLLDTSKFYQLFMSTYEIHLIKGYQLYKYSGFPQLYSKDTYMFYGEKLYPLIASPNFRYYDPLMYSGIIGLQKETNHLIFISGYLFLDNIKPLLSLENEMDIKNYIELRYFNYSPQSVIIHKELSNKDVNWVATFYAETNKKKYLIKISLKGNDTLEEL